jgi:alpha-tubulin suppressor-like RCC1 family protein
VPVAVQGLGSGVQSVAACQYHTCALVNGGVWCWGDNLFDDLGNTSDAGSSVPVAVQGLGSGVQALSVGAAHNCALVNGGVECWGDNEDGDLGNNSAMESNVPVLVGPWAP